MGTLSESEGVSFIAATCAAPKDDLPRLVFADWLQEHGQEDRAEFIAVQCELARLEEVVVGQRRNAVMGGCCERFANNMACDCPSGPEIDALRRRERELIDDHGREWFELLIPGLELVPCLNPGHHLQGQDGTAFAIVRRGFADVLSITAADWLAHADAICKQQPIEKVRLTAWPVVDVAEPYTPPTAERPGLTRWRNTEEWIRRTFADRWPGITFELPPYTFATSPPGGPLYIHEIREEHLRPT